MANQTAAQRRASGLIRTVDRRRFMAGMDGWFLTGKAVQTLPLVEFGVNVNVKAKRTAPRRTRRASAEIGTFVGSWLDHYTTKYHR